MAIRNASDDDYPVEWISTGLSNLDAILGGGIPTRRITEVSGPFSVGKTTLALMTTASAQKNGFKTLWVDFEWSWENDYPTLMGVDLKKTALIQERFAETAIDLIEEWADKNKNGLIVIDAIGAMLPRAEAEKGAEGRVIGGQASMVARFCRKITPLLVLNNIALIALNHEFIDILSSRVMTSGGKKLEHAKAIWLKLRKASKRVMAGERQVGEIIEAEIRKNKLFPSMKQSTELTLIYGEGYSKTADLLENALEKGVITKVGQFYLFEGEKAGRGINGIREALKDPSFAEKVTQALS